MFFELDYCKYLIEMERLKIFSFYLLVSFLFISNEPLMGENINFLYKVKKGDTLLKIAERYNVDVESIIRWNLDKFMKKTTSLEDKKKGRKITDEDLPVVIRPGWKMRIPVRTSDGKWRCLIHRVKEGDTFIGIARSYGVTKVKLYKWNRKLFEEGGRQKKGKKGRGKGANNGRKVIEVRKVETIFPGMELTIHAVKPYISPRVGVYRVKKGDKIKKIARRFRVKLSDILDYNFLLPGDRLKAGQIIEVPMLMPKKKAYSIGSPISGRLVNGEKMPPGPGYYLRSPEFAYGTNETITYIVNCIGEVQKKHPDTPDLVIGHLSKKRGGRFPPHKSHASGRDIDVGYYLKGIAPKKFVRVTKDNFDVKRTTDFILCLQRTQKVGYIFVSYYIQRMIYRFLKSVKNKIFTRAFLLKFIQFPRGIDVRVGLVRHEKGHGDHMHIRFVCPEDSPRCHD